MLIKEYTYYETDEDGVVQNDEPHFISLKATVDPKKVEKKLKVTLIETGEYEIRDTYTEFQRFEKEIGDKFHPLLPTFKYVD